MTPKMRTRIQRVNGLSLLTSVETHNALRRAKSFGNYANVILENIKNSKPSLSTDWFSGNTAWLVKYSCLEHLNDCQDSIYPPSSEKASDGKAPDVSFQLDHIYGYRAHDARNNSFYLSTGSIVHHAA